MNQKNNKKIRFSVHFLAVSVCVIFSLGGVPSLAAESGVDSTSESLGYGHRILEEWIGVTYQGETLLPLRQILGLDARYNEGVLVKAVIVTASSRRGRGKINVLKDGMPIGGSIAGVYSRRIRIPLREMTSLDMRFGQRKRRGVLGNRSLSFGVNLEAFTRLQLELRGNIQVESVGVEIEELHMHPYREMRGNYGRRPIGHGGGRGRRIHE